MTRFPWDTTASPTTPFPRPWDKTETALTPTPAPSGPPPGWGADAAGSSASSEPTRFPWVPSGGAAPSRPATRTPDDVIRTYASWRMRASAFKAASIRSAMGVKVA